jgi:hypothetical protein
MVICGGHAFAKDIHRPFRFGDRPSRDGHHIGRGSLSIRSPVTERRRSGKQGDRIMTIRSIAATLAAALGLLAGTPPGIAAETLLTRMRVPGRGFRHPARSESRALPNPRQDRSTPRPRGVRERDAWAAGGHLTYLSSASATPDRRACA